MQISVVELALRVAENLITVIYRQNIAGPEKKQNATKPSLNSFHMQPAHFHHSGKETTRSSVGFVQITK